MADELVAIDLTDDERHFMFHAINEYGGSAKQAKPLLTPLLGLSNEDEWYDLYGRLREAIRNKEPLSDLDWARALFLTEISFGSDLVGSGLDLAPSLDGKWIVLLRSIQRKVSNYSRFLLLLENSKCRPAESGQA